MIRGCHAHTKLHGRLTACTELTVAADRKPSDRMGNSSVGYDRLLVPNRNSDACTAEQRGCLRRLQRRQQWAIGAGYACMRYGI
jgi:hypothetical protein